MEEVNPYKTESLGVRIFISSLMWKKTTIMACVYDGGILLGADTRTTRAIIFGTFLSFEGFICCK
jgi:hypothetical protein